MRISEDVLKRIFEKSFDDEVENIYSRRSLISFGGEEYSMEYNFLEGYIAFFDRAEEDRIGTVFLHSGSDIFFEIDPSTCFGYYVGLFKHELEKFINSNQKRSRRKFLMR
jgi:hypothetical protein